jgi:hypothetical protein
MASSPFAAVSDASKSTAAIFGLGGNDRLSEGIGRTGSKPGEVERF